MANRKRSDPQEYVTCSGARSGLKREFAFALKSQRDILNSSGRTRSCKAYVVAPAVPPSRAVKRPKKSDDQDKQPATSCSPDEAVIVALPAEINTESHSFPAGRSAVDAPTVGKGNEGYPKSGLGVPISDCSKKEMKMDGIHLGSPVLFHGKEVLKKKEFSVDKSITNSRKSKSKAKLKNSSVPLPLESISVVSEASSNPLKNESVDEHSIVFGGNSCSKKNNSFAEKPVGRFTRPGLKPMPAIATPIRIEQEGTTGEVKPIRRFTRSALKLMMPVAANSFTIDQGSVGEVTHPTFQKENLIKVPIITDNCGSLDIENGQVDESIKVGLKGFVPVTLMSGFYKGNEMDDAVPFVNPTLTTVTISRRKRSLRKAKVKKSAVADTSTHTNVDFVESRESKCDNNTLNDNLTTKLKKKMELKKSKKITFSKPPSNIRELLGTGLLEGLPVKYTSCLGKNIGLQGVIRGNGILCSCTFCQGTIVVSAYQFEIHAGSTKKHPSDFIFLQNGKSIREVLKSCSGASIDSLEAIITNAIGPLPPNRPSSCQKCKELLDTTCSRKFPLLCNSCLESSHQQAIQTLSHGMTCTAKLLGRVLEPVMSDGTSTNLSSQKKPSHGKLTRKDLGLHKLVFMDDILPQGTEVGYFLRGKRLLEGYIKDSGIFCCCCNSLISPSQFEAHAGQAPRRKPYNNIYTSNGVSLHELSVSLSKGRKISATEGDDLCGICADGGDLLLCDLCPRAFHKECVGLSKIPDGDWICQYCQNLQQKDKCLAKNNNAIAAGRVAGVDPIEQIIKRCIRIVSPPENDAGVCALCRQHDFRRSGFDRRTVIICDQCEIEYHVGCLKDHGIADLKKLPQGEWFCCPECRSIHSALHMLLGRGSEALELDANIIRTKLDKKGLSKAAADVRWRLLSGRSDSADSKLLLSQAVSIFRESFDPIIDPISGRDLIPFMVYGRNMRYQDYGGVYCMVLTHKSSVISAGLLRVLGCEIAELPLVATKRDSQGLGYFQSLFSCIERLLKSLKVKHFLLPAADDAVFMWTNKFGFTKLTQTQLLELAKSARPIIFQGTSMLHKVVLGLHEPLSAVNG